jgi:hypothetical protein
MDDQDERLSITAVAEIMNTTPLNVLMHVKRGLLQGIEQDGVWLVERRSLENLLARTGGGRAAGVCSAGCAKRHACGGDCS